ncbi:hypothetical protein V3C99_003994, partial [Haemonchus contortus]
VSRRLSVVIILMRILVATALCLATAQRFDIENRVVQKPVVFCGVDNIVVDIVTEKPFRGRLYVQGEIENRQCLQNGKDHDSNHARFNLPIGACNMRRQRTMHPRGVSFSFTLVVSFHPLFVTGMDRAFHVRCFFLESIKSLATEYGVGSSKLQTELVEQDFQLPDCVYQLHDGPSGPAIHFAQVGQRVTHRWTCEDDSSWIYGLLIHSCYADDGQGNKFELVDDRGCSTDPYLLPQIKYDPKALSASTDAHVFKYADKVQLYFTCTIQLCYKHDGGCDGVTPPKCDQNDTRQQTDTVTRGTTPAVKQPFGIPNFSQEIPFEQMTGDEHPEPHFGPPTMDGHGDLDYFDGLFTGPPPRERNFFEPMDGSKDFDSHPYRDSPLNETDIDDITNVGENLTTIEDNSDKTKKKRRDLNMETDLSVDVIVLPFEKTKSDRPVTPIPHICLSRAALILIALAVVITIALTVVIVAIVNRRSTAYQKAMDAFH